jgi:hypothetical protein
MSFWRDSIRVSDRKPPVDKVRGYLGSRGKLKVIVSFCYICAINVSVLNNILEI